MLVEHPAKSNPARIAMAKALVCAEKNAATRMV
jgi:hypothetical protein